MMSDLLRSREGGWAGAGAAVAPAAADASSAGAATPSAARHGQQMAQHESMAVLQRLLGLRTANKRQAGDRLGEMDAVPLEAATRQPLEAPEAGAAGT